MDRKQPLQPASGVTPGAQPEISIVIPLYNEEAVVGELHRQLSKLVDSLATSVEVILVDDGSEDATRSMIDEVAARDFRFAVVGLSRNFGHQIAITAGMDFARGQAVVIMDGDLQDPPDVVRELIAQWRDGSDIVYAIREDRTGETRFKRFTAAAFYRVFRALSGVDAPPDVGDFRLVDRKALEAVRSMRERHRYVRGMFAWVGFRQSGVSYTRAPRAGGATKYPLRKMVRFAADAIVSFSAVPLRFALEIGLIVSALAFAGGIAAIIAKLAGAFTLPGWASLVVVITFIGGVQLVVLGVIGEYIARIYEEVQHRPLYVVESVRNLPGPYRQPAGEPWIG